MKNRKSRPAGTNPNYRLGRTNGHHMQIPRLDFPRIKLGSNKYWPAISRRIRSRIKSIKNSTQRSLAEQGRKNADLVVSKLNRANVNLLHLIGHTNGFMMNIERYTEHHFEKLCSKKELQHISVRNADVHTVFVIERFGDIQTSGTICISLMDMQIVLTRQEWSDRFQTMYHRLLTAGELRFIDQPSILEKLDKLRTPNMIFMELQIRITIQEIERREREICST